MSKKLSKNFLLTTDVFPKSGTVDFCSSFLSGWAGKLDKHVAIGVVIRAKFNFRCDIFVRITSSFN